MEATRKDADVLIVADLKEFVPVLTAKLLFVFRVQPFMRVLVRDCYSTGKLNRKP
jgi:hypothetical protein